MSEQRLQAIRGMNDVLPQQTPIWRKIEQILTHCVQQYGYNEIRLPLLENTPLFKRTIGEITDIIEKEMYTFTDLNGDSLTLRPEGTAGCVRACLEHGLLHHQQQKLWYSGAMFRHEKPQKGRYRQFHQWGVEAFGISGVAIELELLSMCRRFWEKLGLQGSLHLEINSIGELSERQAYRETLISYLKPHYERLDKDSQRRLNKNPLRILDSKNPSMQDLIRHAPKILDTLGNESRQHFESLCAGLTSMGMDYTINPFLVRGLDYYGHTVFEWVTDQLGSQATVCAGGRFDRLVEQLGGQPTPAIGFAMGMERLILLCETVNLSVPENPPFSLFFITDGDAARQQALLLAEILRDAQEDWCILVHMGDGGFKSQFKKADKSGARLALILGEEEVKHQRISIKDLRVESEQKTLPQSELIEHLQNHLRHL